MKLSMTQKLIALFSGILLVGFFAIFFINKAGIQSKAMQTTLEKSRAITIEAENARNYVGDLWGKYKAFSVAELADALAAQTEGKAITNAKERIGFEITTHFNWTLPVVGGRNVGGTSTQDANYEFRVPKIQPRNPDNKANAMEREMLLELRWGQLKEIYRVDEAANVLRYMRPIMLGENCMGCHGTKADDANGDGIDPLGFRMENWKVGEMHGAFEVLADLTLMQSAIRSSLIKTLLSGGIVLIVSLALIFFSVRKNIFGIRNVIGKLTSFAAQAAAGSEQVASSSQTLAEGASQQAASLEETSSTLEGLVWLNPQNADNARQADNLAGTS